MEWQPIESAPRDEDIWVFGLVKIWVDSCEFEWQGQAGFDSENNIWLTTSYNDAGNVLEIIPTRWMPLPEPPK